MTTCTGTCDHCAPDILHHCARPKGHDGWHSCMPTIDDDIFDFGEEP